MAIGFPRSFINIGRDAIIFKRYLLKDPYNPVSLIDLIQFSTFKISLFYAVMTGMIVQLILSKSFKKYLIFFKISNIPIFSFAVYWQGGDIERYLPLYPAVFLLIYICLIDDNLNLINKYLVLLLICIQIYSSLNAMLTKVLGERNAIIVKRLEDTKSPIKRGSLFVTINAAGELIQFNYNFPLNSINAEYGEFTYFLSEDESWRQKFALKILSTWQKGGDVWISKRVLEKSPPKEWYWAEGDNQWAPWKDVHSFFMQFDLLKKGEDEDGFVCLLQVPWNEQKLHELLKVP